MNRTMTSYFRYGVLLVAVVLYLEAGGRSGVLASAQDFCDDPDVCGPLESCEKSCYVDLFENTCGGYGGVPVDQVRGNCLGTCSDGYCNDFNGENDETCYDDCGSCGDSVCSSAEEYGPTFCCNDCNPSVCSTYGGGCQEEDHEACGEGLGCNAAQTCCTAIAVPQCVLCLANENCVPWPFGPQPYVCVTKGSTCNGVS